MIAKMPVILEAWVDRLVPSLHAGSYADGDAVDLARVLRTFRDKKDVAKKQVEASYKTVQLLCQEDNHEKLFFSRVEEVLETNKGKK